MTGHCLSHSLVSPLRRLDAEQTDFLRVGERATAVRAALKEWLGWWAGLVSSCCWLQIGVPNWETPRPGAPSLRGQICTGISARETIEE